MDLLHLKTESGFVIIIISILLLADICLSDSFNEGHMFGHEFNICQATLSFLPRWTTFLDNTIRIEKNVFGMLFEIFGSIST